MEAYRRSLDTLPLRGQGLSCWRDKRMGSTRAPASKLTGQRVRGSSWDVGIRAAARSHRSIIHTGASISDTAHYKAKPLLAWVIWLVTVATLLDGADPSEQTKGGGDKENQQHQDYYSNRDEMQMLA